MPTTRTKFKFRGYVITLVRTERYSGLQEYPEIIDSVYIVSPVGTPVAREFESVEEAIDWILPTQFSQD